MIDDPHDSITDFSTLKSWSPEHYGILLCMWTRSIPAIARSDEPWRGGLDYLTPQEKNRRIVDRQWKERELKS